jgi:hypothetical protein
MTYKEALDAVSELIAQLEDRQRDAGEAYAELTRRIADDAEAGKSLTIGMLDLLAYRAQAAFVWSNLTAPVTQLTFTEVREDPAGALRTLLDENIATWTAELVNNGTVETSLTNAGRSMSDARREMVAGARAWMVSVKEQLDEEDQA